MRGSPSKLHIDANSWENLGDDFFGQDAIESLNSSLRKLLHYRGHFPTDESVFKLLYLALTNLELKWERSIRDWNNVLGQFSIFFKDRIPA